EAGKRASPNLSPATRRKYKTRCGSTTKNRQHWRFLFFQANLPRASRRQEKQRHNMTRYDT
ncbi:MAG: hypothetical protein IK051_09480, partial [Rhodocyclaceae bacterium]|nr:hypothetical protein [Rhodocyclaceae bacterium]